MAAEGEKAERLAAALRANLARRKAQGRARKAAEAPPAGSDGQPATSDPATQGDAAHPGIVPERKPG